MINDPQNIVRVGPMPTPHTLSGFSGLRTCERISSLVGKLDDCGGSDSLSL